MRLIDGDALLEKAWDADTRIGYVQVVDVGDILEAPTMDLIRCRDCKHYKFTNDYAFVFPEKGCELTGFNDVDEDDFCSRGWRKDGKQ